MRAAYVLLGLVTLTSLRSSGANQECSTHDCPAASSDRLESVCHNNVEGLQLGNVCCEEECYTCRDDFHCKDRGRSPLDCCPAIIVLYSEPCEDTLKAPCYFEFYKAFCRDGILSEEGNICCEDQCGECRGYGCDLRPGGADGCCGGSIKDRGVLCSATSQAPCIIGYYAEES